MIKQLKAKQVIIKCNLCKELTTNIAINNNTEMLTAEPASDIATHIRLGLDTEYWICPNCRNEIYTEDVTLL